MRGLLSACLIAVFSPPVEAGAEEPAAAAEIATYDESITLSGASEQAVAAVPDQAPRLIEEIVVTSTKRVKSVRSLPMSIDAYSGDDLEQRGATGLEEILKLSPGVTFRKGENGDTGNLTIRGIGGNTFFFNRAFGLYFGDVPLINPTFIGPQPDIDPFDLRTVEILKGPQGTLFGGSSLAGAVRYVPNEPDFDESRGDLTYGFGWTSGSEQLNQQYAALFNQPLGQGFALRAAGSVRHGAGYVDDLRSGETDINSSEAQNWRVLGAWRPGQGLRLDLSWMNRSFEADDSSLTDNRSRHQTRHKFFPEWARSRLSIQGLAAESAHFDPFTIRLSSNRMLKDGALRRDLTTVGDFHDTPNRTPQPFDFDVDQWSHELRIVSNRPSEIGNPLLANWEYVLGLFSIKTDQYMLIDVGVIQADPTIFPPPVTETAVQETSSAVVIVGDAVASERALFIDATRHLLGGRLEFNVGLRLFAQKTVGSIISNAVTRPRGGEPQLSEQLDESRGTLRESGLNPKVALTWHIDEQLGVFASAANGFRFGGLNADPFLGRQTADVPTLLFESDEIWNYELGLRDAWLAGQLQLDATVFHAVWNNMQTNQVAQTVPFTTPYIDNIGGSASTGGEIAIRSALPLNLTLALGVAYTEARTTAAFDAPAGFVMRGTRLPNAPLWSASAELSQRQQWRGVELRSTLSYAHQDDSRSDFFNRVPLGAFDTVAVAFHGLAPQLRLAPEMSLTISNVFDRRAVLTAVGDGDGEDGGNVEIFTNLLSPRRALLNLRLHI